MTQATDLTTTFLLHDYNEASKHSFFVLPWLHRFVNLGRATLSVTVQIYNIFHLHKLIDYCHERFSFIRTMPNLVHLSMPEYFNIQNLPDELKQLAIARLESLKERLTLAGETSALNQLDSVLAYLDMGERSPYQMNEFKRVTRIFDQLRSESISQARWLSGKIRNRLLG